jgi:hypothetical protein
MVVNILNLQILTRNQIFTIPIDIGRYFAAPRSGQIKLNFIHNLAGTRYRPIFKNSFYHTGLSRIFVMRDNVQAI